MGYYDGIAATSQASSYAVAAATGTPAVLVVPAKGMGLSVAAVVEGYCRFQPDSHIRGVILNRISPALYQELKVQIEARCGIRVFGYLPEEPELTLASRHLGLLLPEEVAGLREKLQRLAARLEETLDLEGLLTLAGSAPGLASSGPDLTPGEPVRLAVAKDEAFCFYYRENLELLQDLGAAAGSLFSFAGHGSSRRESQVFSWEAAIRSSTGRLWRKTKFYEKKSGEAWDAAYPPWPSAAATCISRRLWRIRRAACIPWRGCCQGRPGTPESRRPVRATSP